MTRTHFVAAAFAAVTVLASGCGHTGSPVALTAMSAAPVDQQRAIALEISTSWTPDSVETAFFQEAPAVAITIRDDRGAAVGSEHVVLAGERAWLEVPTGSEYTVEVDLLDRAAGRVNLSWTASAPSDDGGERRAAGSYTFDVDADDTDEGSRYVWYSALIRT